MSKNVKLAPIKKMSVRKLQKEVTKAKNYIEHLGHSIKHILEDQSKSEFQDVADEQINQLEQFESTDELFSDISRQHDVIVSQIMYQR